MTVTVLAILETDFKPDKNLARVMNDRLVRVARDLQELHFKPLSGRGFSADDLVVYISYNPKYKIRFRIVNDVPADFEYFVAECCGEVGFRSVKLSLKMLKSAEPTLSRNQGTPLICLPCGSIAIEYVT